MIAVTAFSHFNIESMIVSLFSSKERKNWNVEMKMTSNTENFNLLAFDDLNIFLFVFTKKNNFEWLPVLFFILVKRKKRVFFILPRFLKEIFTFPEIIQPRKQQHYVMPTRTICIFKVFVCGTTFMWIWCWKFDF